MKLQSAGRLGNQLFQWAYALDLSESTQTPVTLFFDDFHSNFDDEARLTKTLLSDQRVIFKKSNTTGFILAVADWVSYRYPSIGKKLKAILKISDEWEQFSLENRILRGYFQDSKYTLHRKSEIITKLKNSLAAVRKSNTLLTQLESQYPKYQLIHVRLGDYLNSDFGIVSPKSYESLLLPDMPLFICTNGKPSTIEEMFKIPVTEILDSTKFDAWETLDLMQKAELFIGVNSTLSWWGAFLSVSNGKSAYLPDTWTVSETNSQAKSLEIPGVKRYKTIFTS